MDRFEKKIKLTLEDLPNEDLRLVARNCGLNVATELLNKLPGLTISIPKSGLRKMVNRYICEHYDGSNVKQLALECGVSVRHVYSVIQKNRTMPPTRNGR